eukprot:3770208-Pleurochrysis_carterae.AAC.1
MATAFGPSLAQRVREKEGGVAKDDSRTRVRHPEGTRASRSAAARVCACATCTHAPCRLSASTSAMSAAHLRTRLAGSCARSG